MWSLVLLPLEECRLKILLFQSIPNRPYLYPGSLSAEGGVNIFSNQVFLNAVPKTKPWVLIFLISLLVGIVACGKIFNALTPVLEAAFTFTGSTGMAEASSIKVGSLIFAKNALVAFLCLITARLTLGIYPFIVLVFNGAFVGTIITALVKYGGLPILEVASGILPHIGFELFGIFLACAIGMMAIPLKEKIRYSVPVWLFLLAAAVIESTISMSLMA